MILSAGTITKTGKRGEARKGDFIFIMSQDSQFELKQTPAHIWVGFSTEHPVLSSAVYNGGACAASNLLIMKVANNFEGTKQIDQNPENTLAAYCRQLRLGGAIRS